jgi:hypothetical protein
MKPIFIASALMLSLSACADYQGGMGGRLAYNGYYDDTYGPIYDGYWGEGDTFYYRGSNSGAYLRDDGHHVRHEAGEQGHGYHQIRGHGPRSGGHQQHSGGH